MYTIQFPTGEKYEVSDSIYNIIKRSWFDNKPEQQFGDEEYFNQYPDINKLKEALAEIYPDQAKMNVQNKS